MIVNCGPGAPAVELGEPKTFVLAFDSNGGPYVAPLVYVSDEIMHDFNIPEVEWEGHELISWQSEDGTEYANGGVIRVAEGTTTLYAIWRRIVAAVYALDIAVETSSPTDRCTYPETVEYGGKVYDNECAEYVPASGTELNTWAYDHKGEASLLTGIVPGILKDGVFEEAEIKTAIPTGAEGEDAVTLFPTWYLSMTNDGTTIRVAFASEPLDDTFHDYAGSIGDERVGHFYMSCYDGTGTADAMYSFASGESPTVSISITNLIAGCQARGEGYDLLNWQIWTYLGALTAIIWRSTNLQNSFAYGASGAQLNPCSAIETTELGMAGTAGSSSDHMAFFWIEDLWGNVAKMCGAHTNADRQLEWNTGYCSTTEWDMTELSSALSSNTSGYIKEVVGTSEAGFFPSTMSGGSSTTYFADYGYVVASYFPYVGCVGNTSSTAFGGPFFAYFNRGATNTGTGTGGRLVYRL